MQFTAKINKIAIGLLVTLGLFAHASAAQASTSSVTCNSATLNGHTSTTVFPVSVWFEWGTNSNTVSSGGGTKTAVQVLNANASFSQPLTGLSQNTTYYYRAMAQDHIGPLTGAVISFTTPSCGGNGGGSTVAPSATTNSPSNIDNYSATLNGFVDPKGSNDTVRWFEYGSGYYGFDSSTAQVNVNGSGNVSAYISNLSPNTSYRYRIVARNSQGTSYGATISFRTTTGGSNGQAPSATTRAASNIDNYSATLNGYVDTNGTSDTARWFEWGTSQNNMYRTTTHVNIGYAGDASAYISSLNQNTTYYYRVVAQNSTGTSYGQVLSFTTNGSNNNNGQLPTVSTNSASSIDNYSATLNGYVDTNGTNDTTRWFEYGTSQGNLYNSTSRVNISYAGNVSAYVSNLSSNTTYYYRVAAQNSQGTVYGQVLSFTTYNGGNGNQNLTVTTNAAYNIDNYSATLAGYVNTNGSNYATRWFEYGTSYSNLNNSTSRIDVGYSGDATAYISNLSSNTTYYFRLVAQNSQGTVYGQTLSFTTNGNGGGGGGYSNLPLVTTRSASNVFSAVATINGYVDTNGSGNTYGWFEWGTNQNLSQSTSRTYISNGGTNIASSLTGLSQNTTYYYRAVAQNDSGTVRGSILTFTTMNTGNTDTTGAPSAITTLPTQITSTSAMLNSLVVSGGTEPVRAWFEWGTTQSLSHSTASVNLGSVPSVRHAQTIYGLTSGTTYYFRVVAENDHGKSYGIIRSFVARYPVVVTPKPVTPKTTVKVIEKPVYVHAEGINSLVMLTITGGADTISKGEHRTYHVTWKNDSTQNLTNVVLRVLVPQTMNFESADSGTFSKVDNTLTIELDRLNVGDSGETNLVLNGGDGLRIGDLVVTTANIVYTDESSVQGNALAYTTQRVVDGGGAVLGASVGAAAFPMMLLGWLLLLILLVILIILSMHLYRKLKEGTN